MNGFGASAFRKDFSTAPCANPKKIRGYLGESRQGLSYRALPYQLLWAFRCYLPPVAGSCNGAAFRRGCFYPDQEEFSF